MGYKKKLGIAAMAILGVPACMAGIGCLYIDSIKDEAYVCRTVGMNADFTIVPKLFNYFGAQTQWNPSLLTIEDHSIRPSTLETEISLLQSDWSPSPILQIPKEDLLAKEKEWLTRYFTAFNNNQAPHSSFGKFVEGQRLQSYQINR